MLTYESSSMDLNYKEDEVIAAQHIRFLRSSRVIILGCVGLIGTVYLAFQQYTIWKASGVIPSTWYTPIFIQAIFLTVGLLVYLLAPVIDYRKNSFWKYTYELKFLPDQLYFSLKNKGSGIKYDWKDARKVLESDSVYVIFYGSENNFLIIPKRILGMNELYFRERLAQAKVTLA